MENKIIPESVINYELIKEHFGRDTLMVLNYLKTLPKEDLIEIQNNARLMMLEYSMIEEALRSEE